MLYLTKHPAKEIARKNAVGSQSAKSARAIMLSLTMAVTLSACGDWSSSSDPSGNSSNGSELSTGGAEQVTASAASTPQAGAVAVTTDMTQAAALTAENMRVTGLSCPVREAPGPVKTILNTAADPIQVPSHFMGMHRSLNVASWMTNAFSEIPAPQYNYGVVRNLRVEVDGQEERGFWSNIEVAPGVYDWSYMDKWFAANAGHPVMFMIYGTPSFYQKYPGEPSRWPSWRGIGSPPSNAGHEALKRCLLYTSPSPRDRTRSRMPSSA